MANSILLGAGSVSTELTYTSLPALRLSGSLTKRIPPITSHGPVPEHFLDTAVPATESPSPVNTTMTALDETGVGKVAEMVLPKTEVTLP